MASSFQVACCSKSRCHFRFVSSSAVVPSMTGQLPLRMTSTATHSCPIIIHHFHTSTPISTSSLRLCSPVPTLSPSIQPSSCQNLFCPQATPTRQLAIPILRTTGHYLTSFPFRQKHQQWYIYYSTLPAPRGHCTLASFKPGKVERRSS